MEKKKKRKWKGRLKLFNPKNLEKEVHTYGYNWSAKSHAVLTLCSLLGIAAVGLLFQLKPAFLVISVIAMFVVLPVLVLDVFVKMFEQKRFADASTYMEQMLYSFQKSGKILLALKETRELFEDGQMYQTLTAAIDYLEEGKTKTGKGMLREALELVKEPYQCRKIHMVHELLASAEEYGGDTENSILLLLQDLEDWKRRGYRLQKDKKTSHTDNIISIVVATILCAVALYVLGAMKSLFVTAAPFDIFEVPIIQLSSLLFIIFSLYVFAKSMKSLTRNWLKEDGVRGIDYILQSYQTVVNFDEGKEKRKSLIWAAPFLIAAIPVFLFYKKWLAVILLLIAAFMLFQHRVGYNLAKKDVTDELYVAFPEWLMQLALLMQSNNVHVAVKKSYPDAPDILKPELEKLMERLQDAPDKLVSYTDFCKDFDIPEASSCMKMLHSISETGTGNAKVQISDLLKRVNEMKSMADEIRNRSISFQMKMIFVYPVAGATVKLLIDLTIGMIYMFQMLGNMGGV